MPQNNCLNCKTPLEGSYCYSCGQPDRTLVRFFPVLLRDLLSDALDLDSRFARTFIPLLFRPGRLTNEYVVGRRARYVPPLRLYLFSSLLFFVFAALVATSPEGEGSIVNFTPDETITSSSFEKVKPKSGLIDQDDIGIDLSISSLDYLNDQIEVIKINAQKLSKDPQKLVDSLFDILPQTMFFLLPFFALLLKFVYAFRKRFYVEHLIYALHTHSFIFTFGIILIGLDKLESISSGIVESSLSFISLLIGIWMPVYLFLALKKVYGQGWFMTTVKAGFVALCYSILLLAVFLSTTLYSVWSY